MLAQPKPTALVLGVMRRFNIAFSPPFILVSALGQKQTLSHSIDYVCYRVQSRPYWGTVNSDFPYPCKFRLKGI